MADDYIGRKMEDLRAGRLGTSSSHTPAPRKGMLQIPFPSRRVLVAIDHEEICRAVTHSFVKAGCRVAVMHRQVAITGELSGEGARVYHLDGEIGESIGRSIANLFAAWHDIDVVVAGDEYAGVIADSLGAHREVAPLRNPFGGRYMVVGRLTDSCCQMSGFISGLSEFGIAVNRILWSQESPDPEGIARLCLFLSAPGNDSIRGAAIPVNRPH